MRNQEEYHTSMKLFLLICPLIMLSSCFANNQKNQGSESSGVFYVGTYTRGESQGIYKYMLHDDGTLDSISLAAKAANPSFLALSHDRRFLVSVSEVSSKQELGSLISFAIEGDSLALINQTSSGGAHPCFVAVNEEGYVLAANYTGGNVGLTKLNEKGELSALLDVQQHSGSDISDRQKGPHAHSVWFDPDGHGIISVDLGTNELWFSELDRASHTLKPSDQRTLPMKAGAGPRHLTFHPNGKWLYVVNELDCTVTLVEKEADGSYARKNSVSTLPADFTEYNTCADIHISSDGHFVYASNRGHNSIAIFRVDGEDGSLEPVGHQSTMGETPRNFSLSPDGAFLLAANQRSNTIVSFTRNSDSGLLEYTDQIKAPAPVCILFY